MGTYINEGLPESFIVKKEEVRIELVVVDQLHPDLVLAMGEGAIGSILAIRAIIRIVDTELGLVFLEAVELLHLVVALLAALAARALEFVVLVLDMLSIRTSTFWAN